MKIRLAVLLLVPALAAGALTATRGPAAPDALPPCKPDAPLLLSARLAGDPHAGATCGVVVSFTALADGDVSVNVSLPAGVTHVRGDRSFAAPLRRGEARELRFDVLVGDTNRREIMVGGCLRQGTAKLACVCALVLNENGPAPAPKAVRKINARGEAILEMKQE